MINLTKKFLRHLLIQCLPTYLQSSQALNECWINDKIRNQSIWGKAGENNSQLLEFVQMTTYNNIKTNIIDYVIKYQSVKVLHTRANPPKENNNNKKSKYSVHLQEKEKKYCPA